MRRATDEELAEESRKWDSGELKPTDEGWVDAPEATNYRKYHVLTDERLTEIRSRCESGHPRLSDVWDLLHEIDRLRKDNKGLLSVYDCLKKAYPPTI